MFGRIVDYLLYAKKAAVAALAPVVVELVDNLAVEMSNLVQVGVTAVLGLIAVFVAKNAATP